MVPAKNAKYIYSFTNYPASYLCDPLCFHSVYHLDALVALWNCSFRTSLYESSSGFESVEEKCTDNFKRTIAQGKNGDGNPRRKSRNTKLG